MMNKEQTEQPTQANSTHKNTLPSNRALIVLFVSIAVLTYISVTLHDHWQHAHTVPSLSDFMKKILKNH